MLAKKFVPSPVEKRSDLLRQWQLDWFDLDYEIWTEAGVPSLSPLEKLKYLMDDNHLNHKAMDNGHNINGNINNSCNGTGNGHNNYQSNNFSFSSAAGQPESESGRTSTSEDGESMRIHVSNIPFRFREIDLRQLFAPYGHILDVEIIFNERGSKGFGFLTFALKDQALKAMNNLDGKVVEGRQIEVNYATVKGQSKKITSQTPKRSPGSFSPPNPALTSVNPAAIAIAEVYGSLQKNSTDYSSLFQSIYQQHFRFNESSRSV